MKLFKLSCLVLIFALFSCKTATPELAERPDMKALVKNPATTIVDVRIPEQFKENGVKEATNIPLAEIENNLDFFRSKENIVVYCNRGRQAEEAVKILKKKGINNVYSAKTVENVKAIQNEKK